MKKPLLTSETSFSALTAVMHTLDKVNVTTPTGLDVSTVVASTDIVQDFENRFDLDPGMELLARLDEIQKLNHDARILDLVELLGVKAVWDVLANPGVYTPRYGAFWEPEHLLDVMMSRRLLPCDASVFIDGAAYPDLIESRLHRLHLTEADQDTLVDFCLTRGWDIDRLLSNLAHYLGHGGLNESNVDKVVAWVNTQLDAGRVTLDDHRALLLGVEETERLINRGTRADLVVAAKLGFASHHETRTQLLSTPAGRAIALRYEPVKNLTGPVDYDLLTPDAAGRLLDSITVTDTDTLLRVLKLSRADRKWILGKLPLNQPTPDQVLAALAGQVIALSELYYVLAFTKGAKWHNALPDVPGLAATFLRDLVERGSTCNTPNNDQSIRDEIVLGVIAAELNDDVELWQRLFTATEKSPFALEDATVSEVANMYRSRWAAARARRS